MLYKIGFTLSALFFLFACGSNKEQSKESITPPKSMINKEENFNPMENKGIGPVKEITLAEIDMALAEEGKNIFSQMCTACHKTDKKFIGPSPAGVLKRRSPEWIMNMILNPEVMVKEDPIAKKLLVEYNMAPMANQGLTEEQARAVLEFFRTLD